MATTDVFNNPTNNYVNPGLSPCQGAGDDSYLVFLPNKSIGVIQGSNVLAGISFSDIKIPVSAYSSQKKVLEPGEVTFIQGLTKGLNYRSQAFDIPVLYDPDNVDNHYYMVIDLSIGFYQNFGYRLFNMNATSDVSNNVSVADALNIAFSNIQAKVSSVYDPSDLTFTGTQQGWDFNISNVQLTLIDASLNPNSPFPSIVDSSGNRVPQIYTLPENISKMVLYAKYPNSAMQGIIMKVLYAADASSVYDEWVYVNHVPDMATIYEPTDVSVNFVAIPSMTFNTIFGPFTGGATINQQDISINGASIINEYDVSCLIEGGSITDSSLYACDLRGPITLSNVVLENTMVNQISVDPLIRISISNSLINDCSIMNTFIQDTSIYDSFLYDVSLLGCTLYNCQYEDPMTIQSSKIITIDQSLGVTVTFDTSTYYLPVIKTIEVGMSGCSSQTAMSAGDYLAWITENDAWEKVGDMYIWTSAPDADDTRNLIEGFYVFNPHGFAAQLEYLIFV